MPIACSNGCDVAGAASWSAIVLARALTRTMLMPGEHQRTVLAHDQQLGDNRSGDRGRRLVVNLLEPDRADQTINIRLGESEFPHGADKARAFGLAADQPDIAEAPRLERRRRNIEVERMAVRH